MTPRPAATVLLLRDGARGLEVFMVVRHHLMNFASALVFPGGRVDDADAALAADAGLCPPIAGVAPLAMASRVAGIRETFEECGILLARPRGSKELAAPDGLGSFRKQIHESELDFSEFLRAQNLVLAPDLLTPFAHWITPIVFPKRYDTHFFLAVAPSNHAGRHDGRESVDSRWVSPPDAIADCIAERCKLEFATRRNIEKLGRAATLKDAMAAAAAPILTVLPTVTESPEGLRVRIPPESGYGGEHFFMNG